MTEEDDTARGFGQAIRDRMGVLIGIVGLIAWGAMLWFMFGDVL